MCARDIPNESAAALILLEHHWWRYRLLTRFARMRGLPRRGGQYPERASCPLARTRMHLLTSDDSLAGLRLGAPAVDHLQALATSASHLTKVMACQPPGINLRLS
jgi:hypothetical protein